MIADYFDAPVDRRGTASTKWSRYGPDVLPFWVADMDFKAPPGLLKAVAERLRHGVLGYTDTPAPTQAAFIGWLRRCYGWEVSAEWLIWLPGVVPGMNLAGRVAGGDSLLIPTPVYHPFLAVPRHAGKASITVALTLQDGRWVMDMERLEAALTPDTRALLLCNPQNPTGRIYERSELMALAELCRRRGLTLVSDEIHCELVLDPTRRHIPVATLAPDLPTVTLFSPNKAYNTPGVGSAVAVIPDPVLRLAFRRAFGGLISHISPLAYAAAQWAYADETDWLPALNAYLRGNGDVLQDTVARLPGVAMTHVEGTYLGWMDVRELGLPALAEHFERHGLGLNDGAAFGAPGFLRFNFGCPRATLEAGLTRLERAVLAAA